MKVLGIFIICFVAIGIVKAQENTNISGEEKFSNPMAPVGDDRLTVTSCVKPLFDHWMRDPYVMFGPDKYYYMVGTTADPDRKFVGQKHCWDYNDGLYMWRSKDMKTWESRGRIWSYDEDATWQKNHTPIVPEGKKSINGDPLDSIFRAVWAPELHYIKSKNQWLLIACQNKGGGSFILKSTSGKPEGPYVNIEGNSDGPIFKKID
ncbi:MAG: family 43 glycosylhydrolase, partial [Bacteroidales bacterium]|nr:family 43 glycosylhydrolase [Bacteroidales bacterium]